MGVLKLFFCYVLLMASSGFSVTFADALASSPLNLLIQVIMCVHDSLKNSDLSVFQETVQKTELIICFL